MLTAGPHQTKQVQLAAFQQFIPQDNTARIRFECDKVFKRYANDFKVLQEKALSGAPLEKGEVTKLLALLPLKYGSTDYADLELHYKLWVNEVYTCSKCCCMVCICNNASVAEKCITRYPDGYCCVPCCCFGCSHLNPCSLFDKRDYNTVMQLAEVCIGLPSKNDFYLIHKSNILQAKSLDELKFDDLVKTGRVIRFNFDKYPRYTFVSHKWYPRPPSDVQDEKNKGTGVPDEDNKFFHHLRHLADVVAEEFFWIDWCCFQQDWEVAFNPQRTVMLESIPRILLGASHVELFRFNVGYQASVWCAMESVTSVDDGFLNHYAFNIAKIEDFQSVFPQLFRTCIQFSSLRYLAAAVQSMESRVRTGATVSMTERASLEKARQELQALLNNGGLYGVEIKNCCGKANWYLGSPMMWTKNPILVQLCLYYFIKFEGEHLNPNEMIRDKPEKIGKSQIPKHSKSSNLPRGIHNWWI